MRPLAVARQVYAAKVLPHVNLTSFILVGTVAAIAYLVVAPIIFLIWSSFRSALPTPADPGVFTLENYVFVYTSPATYTLFFNTVIFVAVCTSIALVFAVTFAWLIERTDLPGKRTLFVLILLPSAVPSLLMGISYIILAGPEAGLLNRFTEELFGVKPFNIFSIPAMFVLQGVNSVPGTFLIVLAALRSMDPALEEAACVSGVGWASTIRRVTLPMMLPAVLSAGIYTGMNIAETFEIPALIGVPIGFNVLSSQVYLSIRVWGNHTVASAYSVIFLILLVGMVYLYQRATRHSFRYTTISGKGYRPKLMPIGRWRYPAVVLIVAYFAVTAGLPLLVFVWSSVFPSHEPPTLAILSQASLEGFKEVFGNSTFLRCVKNTILLMVLTPVLTVGLISIASWLIVRSNLSLKSKTLLDTLTFWPHAYPGIVLGVALLWFFIVVDFPPVWGTLWPIVLGLTVSYMPFTVRTLNAAFIQVHQELEQAAYVSGASWLSTFVRITLPLILPALASAALWIAIHAMRSLTVPMFLTAQGNEVLSMLLWTYWDNDMVEAVSVIGLLYLVVCVALSLLWRRIGFKELQKA
ncbi:MAG TPA: iron ABC transporter permease [Candidatus Acidoferrales bacterium]|nr:iron ABC transporter permease [Candidatus Acidoferrales bacterium]